MTQWLPYISLASLLVAICALAVAAFVAMRAGRWRESDEAKAMASNIAAVTNRVSAVENNKAGEDDLAVVCNRVTALEAGMANVATKADVAALKAEMQGLERTAAHTAAGVSRIEGHLMGVRA